MTFLSLEKLCTIATGLFLDKVVDKGNTRMESLPLKLLHQLILLLVNDIPLFIQMKLLYTLIHIFEMGTSNVLEIHGYSLTGNLVY